MIGDGWTRGLRSRRPLSLLPVLDLLVALLAFGVGVLTVVNMAVARTVTPLEAHLSGESKRLNRMRESAAALVRVTAGEPRAVAPQVLAPSKEHELMKRLLRLKDDVPAVADAEREILVGGLKEVARDQRTFWGARASELCEPGPDIPDAPAVRTTDVSTWIDELGHLVAYRDAIWKGHTACQVEAQFVIPESLLQFQYDKFDQLDMSPYRIDRALAEIRKQVDEHIGQRRNKIFVRGYCDEHGDLEYNYTLSFRRAQYVAAIIRKHLESRQLHEGKDYLLFLEGMGTTRPLQRREGETDDDYFRRSRRIELGFQKIYPGDLKW